MNTECREVREAGRISDELESYYLEKADEFNLSTVDKMPDDTSIVYANGKPIKESKDQRIKVDINKVSREVLEALREDANEYTLPSEH